MVEEAEPIIYVVYDDEAVRDSLKLLLEAYGMKVEDYRSSEEFARSYVPGRGVCLILDLHLPGARGLDYLAKQDDAAAELPVIIFGEPSACRAIGCARFSSINRFPARYCSPVSDKPWGELDPACSSRSVIRRHSGSRPRTIRRPAASPRASVTMVRWPSAWLSL